MRLSILSALDPLVRDVTAMVMSDTCTVLILNLTEPYACIDATTPEGRAWHVKTELTHSCISCSLRYAVIPFLEENVDFRFLTTAPFAWVRTFW